MESHTKKKKCNMRLYKMTRQIWAGEKPKKTYRKQIFVEI